LLLISVFGLPSVFGSRISDFTRPLATLADGGREAEWSLDNGRVPPLIFFDFVFALIEDSVRTIDVGHIFRVWLVVF
jgi:hypothetical protein